MSTTTSDAAESTDRSDHDTRFFGQPWALAHIFGVEMWERFSFYGMQGILLIYMYYSVRTRPMTSAARRRKPPARSPATSASKPKVSPTRPRPR